MCLAAVYTESHDDRHELVLDKVQLIEISGEKLTLTKGIGLIACMAGLFLLNK